MKKLLFFGLTLSLLSGCSHRETVSPVEDFKDPIEGYETGSDEMKYFSGLYGFSLTFPESWDGYKTVESQASYGDFEAPVLKFKSSTRVDLFAVSVFTPEQWAKVEAEEGPKPEKLGEAAGYVFGWESAQDFAGAEDLVKDLPTIKASFAAL
jgi:hypothetical protein